MSARQGGRANAPQKTREEIKAEREARKAAKANARAIKTSGVENAAPVANCKASTGNAKVDVATGKANEAAGKTKGTPVAADCNEKDAKAIGVATNAAGSHHNGEAADKAIQSTGVVQNGASEDKSKAELRAERRAKQEAQRAAKQKQQQQQSSTKNSAKSVEAPKPHVEALKPRAEALKPRAETASESPVTKTVVAKTNRIRGDEHEVHLFKHLYQERHDSRFHIPMVNANIHLAIVKLGVQYANKIIVGGNARCLAFLAAIKQMLRDFERPVQADFVRGFEARLKESQTYLHHCRPLGVSMQNAIHHIRWQMTQLPTTLADEEAKSKLLDVIDTYISEQIQLAGKAISITIQSKISDGDVILTYGYSSLINKILMDAHAVGKQFSVIVVDGRPWLEGKEQLRRLTKLNIDCSYIMINALSFIMPQVSKVFLGAHAILANGAVMSRVGTAQVALVAKAFNVPVLVACETHKSSERVQTDSIVHNELGNADELVNHRSKCKRSLLSKWRMKKSLNLLNITYDVTPADLVTAVVTELAILPCTSVPVILRIK
ncbi:PREDICTED: translation initiation factor eIF-2B subunit delta [Vollenhovia emeryi]|uniref:translation initiation factor eIF-2B subunit delta n=1 Tax=Vollenhovia emeryi TaxID=411798 RepID=UPI0005F47A1B|nr:PREDICTED: translation initiation factor eIF-2B subunit delta [Vollenhovia emeryi]